MHVYMMNLNDKLICMQFMELVRFKTVWMKVQI